RGRALCHRWRGLEGERAPVGRPLREILRAQLRLPRRGELLEDDAPHVILRDLHAIPRDALERARILQGALRFVDQAWLDALGPAQQAAQPAFRPGHGPRGAPQPAPLTREPPAARE